MKASALLSLVKVDLETLVSYRTLIEQKLRDDKEPGSIGSVMTRYNYSNFTEILCGKSVDLDFEVDEKKLEDFRHRIDNYLDLYAPGDEDLKKYVKGISTYLAFIARRPLHPPGIRFSSEATVFEKNGLYYCSGRRTFAKEDLSLCKYCICKAV